MGGCVRDPCIGRQRAVDLATGSVEEIEEERRLFYVALTRARDWLYVCALARYLRKPVSDYADPWGYAQLTRFLPPEVREAFEVRVVGGRSMEEDGVGGVSKVGGAPGAGGLSGGGGIGGAARGAVARDRLHCTPTSRR